MRGMEHGFHPPFSYIPLMAKTKNISPEPGAEPIEPTGTEVPVQDEVQGTPEVKTKKKEPAPETPAEIPAHVRALLQKFPEYEALYIDADGGMYTPNVAPAIRKGAVLYRNPYHQS